jgi:hypothetical protein
MKKIIAIIVLFTIMTGCGKTTQLINITPTEAHNKIADVKPEVKSNVAFYTTLAVATIGTFIAGWVFKDTISNNYYTYESRFSRFIKLKFKTFFVKNTYEPAPLPQTGIPINNNPIP